MSIQKQGKPFQFGNRRVQLATDFTPNPDNHPMVGTARTFLIDCETGKELTQPIDTGDMVIHPSSSSRIALQRTDAVPAGGVYVISPVVDADGRILSEGQESPLQG